MISNCDIVIATPRELDVVYNPAKGMHYTDEIIRRMCGGGGGGKKVKTLNWNDGGGSSGVEGSIRFTPIGKGVGGRERMTGEEVVDLLRRSKVVRVCKCVPRYDVRILDRLRTPDTHPLSCSALIYYLVHRLWSPSWYGSTPT